MLVIAMLGAGACAPDAPTEPTWAEDIKPILQANCIRCHGEPPIGGAPFAGRLDVMRDTTSVDGQRVSGAGSYAAVGAQLHSRVSAARGDPDALTAPMPPQYPLVDWQVETIGAWSGTARGARSDNHEPELEIAESGRDGTLIEYEYDLVDLDGETVYGEIRDEIACSNADGVDDEADEADDDTQPRRPLATLHAGRGALSIETAGLAEGSHTLEVTLDDGTVDGTYERPFSVVHEGGNVPPRAVFCSPEPHDFIGDNADSIEVMLRVADADAATPLEVEIRATEALQAADPITIVDDLAVGDGEEATVVWNIADVPGGIWWLEIEITDGTSTTTWRRGPIKLEDR